MAESTKICDGSVLTMAESTNKFYQYFGRLGHKKKEKKGLDELVLAELTGNPVKLCKNIFINDRLKIYWAQAPQTSKRRGCSSATVKLMYNYKWIINVSIH